MTDINNIPRPPPDPRPSFEPPRINSIYNVITRRIRIAGTVFGDRVKLCLRQTETEFWTKLARPYLLVVPRQVRAPRNIDLDFMSFVNPREVILVAQFDDRGSEMSYLAANDIDTAERQLIVVLANWRPFQWYKPTMYGGMRIQATRAPDVRVHYTFNFSEEVVLPEDAPEFEEGEPDMVMEGIHINFNSNECCYPEPVLPPGPEICVTAGGCRTEPEPDPCPEPECPPILEDSDAAPKP